MVKEKDRNRAFSTDIQEKKYTLNYLHWVYVLASAMDDNSNMFPLKIDLF